MLIARDGAEAVECAAHHGDVIDLVLLDVLMPVMTGPTAYRHIRAANPTLPILFMTGYTDEANAAQLGVGDDVALIQKPFKRHTLLRAIQRAMSCEPDKHADAPH